MSNQKQTKSDATAKQPKVVKVSTLIKLALVAVAVVAAFVAGTIYADSYNDSVEAKAVELASKLDR